MKIKIGITWQRHGKIHNKPIPEEIREQLIKIAWGEIAMNVTQTETRIVTCEEPIRAMTKSELDRFHKSWKNEPEDYFIGRCNSNTYGCLELCQNIMAPSSFVLNIEIYFQWEQGGFQLGDRKGLRMVALKEISNRIQVGETQGTFTHTRLKEPEFKCQWNVIYRTQEEINNGIWK